ncbi:MAG: HNH endonuclease [Planctomycetaceae bacterium]|nr:HNH endonuclease [Planctomycetaceae bacterium]
MKPYVSVELQRRVRQRFADCCAYCHTAEDLTATTFEFEHIVPIALGGETTLVNLCLACPMCNRYKSDQVLVPDAVTQTDVPLFHPHQDRWADHFAWNESSTEIIGLTAIGRATITALRMNRSQMIRVRQMWVAMHQHPPTFAD